MTSTTVATCIRRVAVDRADLTVDQAEEAVGEILDGLASPAQIGALLAVLLAKGESPVEIEGCVRAMLRRVVRVDPGQGVRAVDLGGTGGDGIGTFNISTTAALVVAAAGAPVLKHGNRAATSRTGSADLMAALGVPADQEPNPEAALESLRRHGFAYLFTPAYHGFPAELSRVRREIGTRSLFNLAAPLAHPAPLYGQLLGVADPALTELLGDVLRRLGRQRAFVVHGADGSDELSITGDTLVTEVHGGRMRTYPVTPEEVGLRRARLSDLRGGNPRENAEITQEVLAGRCGPTRDAVLFTAGAGLLLAELAQDWSAAIAMAAATIDGGHATALLTALRQAARGHEPEKVIV